MHFASNQFPVFSESKKNMKQGSGFVFLKAECTIDMQQLCLILFAYKAAESYRRQMKIVITI